MEKIINALENLKAYCEKLDLNDGNIRRKLHIFCRGIESELMSGWKHSESVLEGEREIIKSNYSGMISLIQGIGSSVLMDDAEANKAFKILVPLSILIKTAHGVKDKLVKLENRVEFEEEELKKMLADL